MPGQPGPIYGQPSSNDPANPYASMLNDTPSARDTLMGLSRGLLAAGGPSSTPIGLGQALGQGLSGALAANEGLEDKRLKRALVGSQVQTAQDEIARQRAITKSILDASGPDPATPVSSVTPSVGGPTPLTPGVGASPGKLPAEWDPHYQKASADTGISVDLLKAKDLVESAGNPNAVSSAGATGPAQLMPGTAADLGVTNSRDPAQAIGGGAKYLKQQYDKYKNADIALMAYNWGPGSVDNWIRTGADPNQVPAETKNYLAKIHANLGTSAPSFAGGQPPPAQMPGPPAGLVPPGATAQMPGAPNGLIPPGPPPAPMPGVIPPGSIAQPPVQLAGAPAGGPPGMPPQGDAAPAGGQQVAQAAPITQPNPVPMPPTAGAPAANTLRQVIKNLSPAERELLAHQKPDEVAKFLMARAAPNHATVFDTVDGTVKFVDNSDPEIGRRYQPVKGAELAVAMRNAAAAESQARAREEANRIRGANEPLQPGAPGMPPTPTPGYAEQKGAVAGAEAGAKVGPALLQHQGELVIKDSQGAQVAADHARVGIANLQRLGSLLDQVNTGKFQGTVQEMKAAAKSAGVDLDALGVGDNVGIAQAAQALTGQLALQLRDPSAGGGMPGAMSDQDRKALYSMVAQIGNDPAGNKLMLDWQKKLYQRNIEVAKIVNDYGRSPEFLKDPTGVYAKVREYADKNPLFDPAKDMPKATAPAAVRRFNPATGRLE